ncbi:hypothetical protein [Paraburkholderia sp. JHI869]|uniref:hypothetical protein n=1 Tax=Paraburkholderia sp. JHI869 TaxID=3112959 RepID=UPI0031785547
MLNAPGHDDSGDSGLRECPYCAARFNASLALCPQCGANQLAAAARLAGANDDEPDEQTRGVADRLRANLGALPGGLGGNRVYNGEYPSIDEEHIAERSRRPRYAWAGLGALAIALAGFAFLHRGDWEPKLGAQVVVGSVTGASSTQGTQATHGAKGTLAAAQANAPAAALPRAHAAQRSVAQQNAPAAARAPASPRYASAHADVARNLTNARLSLDKNNLWPARQALRNALAVEPDNPDALQMQTDLVAREQQRDALIGQARQCAHERQWACVRQDAGHAVEVDASSREARHLLASAERRPGGARRTGWNWPWESQYAQADDARSRQESLFWHH